jgi:hypothetical protein
MTPFRLTASVLALLAAIPALAQQRIAPTRTYGEDQAYQTYETPKYRPAPPTPLEKNYGLPTFGMQGAELPQQRTQAPKAKPPVPPDPFSNTPPEYTSTTPQPEPPDTPNFFSDRPPDFTLPPPQPAPSDAGRDNAGGNARSAPTTYGSGTSTNYSTGPAFSTGSSTYSSEPSSYSTDPSRTETPLFTTSQGMSTGEDTTTPYQAR